MLFSRDVLFVFRYPYSWHIINRRMSTRLKILSFKFCTNIERYLTQFRQREVFKRRFGKRRAAMIYALSSPV